MSVASTYHSHGFDERKIETHVEYCKHLLNAAKIHRDAAEQAEQQNKQKMEVARQIALAEEARRRAEEQRKFQVYMFLEFLHKLQISYLPKYLSSVVNTVFVTVRKEEGRGWAKASKTTGGTFRACEGILYVSLNQRKQLKKKTLLVDLIKGCTLKFLLALELFSDDNEPSTKTENLYKI